MTTEHTYKIIELVGTSPNGLEKAIENAISAANESLKGLDWFEVREIRGNVQDGKIGWFQVKLGIGFRVAGSDDLSAD